MKGGVFFPALRLDPLMGEGEGGICASYCIGHDTPRWALFGGRVRGGSSGNRADVFALRLVKSRLVAGESGN